MARNLYFGPIAAQSNFIEERRRCWNRTNRAATPGHPRGWNPTEHADKYGPVFGRKHPILGSRPKFGDLWLLPLTGSFKPVKLLASPADEMHGNFVSGSAAGAEMMTTLARTRGPIVVVAIYAEPSKVDLFRFFWREL